MQIIQLSLNYLKLYELFNIVKITHRSINHSTYVKKCAKKKKKKIHPWEIIQCITKTTKKTNICMESGITNQKYYNVQPLRRSMGLIENSQTF